MRQLLIYPIRFYRYAVSPMLGPSCRFHPSCSEYAKEAITKHGLVHGLFLAIKRVLRCNPFSKGGYDPVPKFVINSKHKTRNTKTSTSSSVTSSSFSYYSSHLHKIFFPIRSCK